jgi:glycosyltransferase involved in cell wall biosynthesis
MTACPADTPADSADLPLVSVIIPACNAATTLAETLASVRAQTHRNLEVVVVDDGSVDATAAIVAAAAAQDSRVRLVRQANAGVAAARNRGIAATSGAFVALLDADDLWARDKIARQVAALQAAGDAAGLCYTWFVTIDATGRILKPGARPQHQGAVLAALCADNFVGNGSSMLLRRTALDRVGGFDASLRERGAQGCDDYDLLLRVAEHYDFVLVKEALVGYRVSAGSVSQDRARMLRSWRMVAEHTARRRPDLAAHLIRGRTRYAVYLMVGVLLRGQLRTSVTLARRSGLPLWRLAPPLAGEMAVRVFQAMHKTGRRWLSTAPRFGDTLGEDRA